MSLKCISFTNGMRLPIFSHPDYPDYETYSAVDTPHETICTYVMQDAYITAANLSGEFLNPQIAGQTLTDKDGNTWAFTRVDDETIDLVITAPGGATATCHLYAKNTNQPSAYVLCATGYDSETGLKIHICALYNIYTMSRRVDEMERDNYIVGSYVQDWNYDYNFYSDLRRVDRVGTGVGEWGDSNTYIHNIFEGTFFVNTQGLVLSGRRGSPESVPSLTFYTAPINGVIAKRTNLSNFVFSNSVEDIGEEEPDPYDKEDPSGPGGGGGDHTIGGDDIDIPPLPSLDATDTGFITLYNPNLTQLQNLAAYMWSGAFDIASFRKLFADPMDCILGLSIVPVSIPNGASRTIKVGNVSTGISMTVAGAQYIEVDCGSVNVKEYFGAYLDYEPYTHAELYLPYIGTHPLSIDEIMAKTVTIKYHVDILTGSCTAFVKCGNSVLYEFIGQCSIPVPICSTDWSTAYSGALSIAGAIGSMIAGSGPSAPIAVSNIASTAINSMKPTIEKSGAMAGTGGMLAIQKPYLTISRPKQALPFGQNSYIGYPSYITEYLGSLSGYTEIDSVHLTGIFATNEELSEIETLLKSGVIL